MPVISARCFVRCGVASRVASGSSEGRLTCVTPPIAPATVEAQRSCTAGERVSVPVRVTLNGNNSKSGDESAMTSDDTATIQFTYHYGIDGWDEPAANVSELVWPMELPAPVNGTDGTG